MSAADYQALMAEALRREIDFFNLQILVLVLFVSTASLALYAVAHLERLRSCALLVPIVIISGLFAIGRADLLMHRAGDYLARVETEIAGLAPGQGWEHFKNGLAATSMLPLYDAAALVLWIYLFVWAERRAWTDLNRRRRLAYLILTVGLAATGVASIVYGALGSS